MPTGIPYIIVNDVAERFSFYGVRAILVIFMTQYLMTSYSLLKSPPVFLHICSTIVFISLIIAGLSFSPRQRPVPENV